jgi:hypothetical protein
VARFNAKPIADSEEWIVPLPLLRGPFSTSSGS